MTTYLCTEADVARLTKSENTYSPDDPPRRIPVYSERIAEHYGFGFEPMLETITIVPNRMNINSRLGLIDTNKPILELVSVTIGSEAQTVGTHIELYPPGAEEPPKKLRIKSQCRSWRSICASPSSSLFTIQVVAWTGYKKHAALEGWQLTGDTVPEGGLASTTAPIELAVSDAEGFDPNGLTPRYSVGSLLLIGSVMYRVIQIIDPQHIVILPAQRGTSPAAQVEGEEIYLWNVERVIRHAAALWTHLSYQKKGTYDTVRLDGLSTTVFAADVPREVVNILNQFKPYGAGAFAT